MNVEGNAFVMLLMIWSWTFELHDAQQKEIFLMRHNYLTILRKSMKTLLFSELGQIFLLKITRFSIRWLVAVFLSSQDRQVLNQ